jgi:hypothetical protein
MAGVFPSPPLYNLVAHPNMCRSLHQPPKNGRCCSLPWRKDLFQTTTVYAQSSWESAQGRVVILLYGILSSVRAWLRRRPLQPCFLRNQTPTLLALFYELERLLEFPVIPVFVFEDPPGGPHGQRSEHQQLMHNLRCSLMCLGITYIL